jgi:hypothetical protein
MVFPATFVTVQVTGVEPRGKKEPEDGLQTTVSPGLDTGGAKLTIAPFWPKSLNTVMSEGQENCIAKL